MKKYLLYSLIFSIFVLLRVADVQVVETTVEPQTAWLPIVALGASVLGAVLQGAQQRRQARQLEAQNTRPSYQNNTNLAMNQAIARERSRVGLPDQVYNNVLRQNQQAFATGLRQLNNRGNVAYNTNAIVSNMNNATSNLNAQDAQARLQGENMLMNANTAVANDDRYAFNVNQLQPYQMNAQNVASMRRAGTQNIFGGLGMLAQGASMGVFGNLGRGGGLGYNPNASLYGQGQGYIS